jgi:regulator of cell morphogenesis and NO signaling
MRGRTSEETNTNAVPAGADKNLDLGQAISEIVLEHPECAAVFQRHRIDFCCRGERSLDSACEERGVDRSGLLRELSGAIAERSGLTQADPRALSTPALVAHIISTHHAYLRRSLPFLRDLAAKVARVHGDHNPQLRKLSDLVGALTDALLPHLDDEEQSLFPLLMATNSDPIGVERSLSAMREEHLAVGALLEQMREQSYGYTVPEWGCRSYRTLFAELATLETDTLRHVHIENHVLAPRAQKRC